MWRLTELLIMSDKKEKEVVEQENEEVKASEETAEQ